MIVTDLDGTLLAGHETVPEENVDALQKAGARGIRIAIASGRLPAVCSRIALNMGLPSCLIIGMNGAQIWDRPFGKPLFEKTYDPSLASGIVDILDKSGVIYNVYTLNGVYTNRQASSAEAERFRNHFAGAGVRVEIGPDAGKKALDGTVVKFLFKPADHPEGFRRAEELLRALPDIYLTSSSKDNLEIMQAGTGKAEGVLFLAKWAGISPSSVMAFGDYDNDMEMLKACGHPVAMGNASEAVKAAARYITADNRSAGVGKAIRALLNDSLTTADECSAGDTCRKRR